MKHHLTERDWKHLEQSERWWARSGTWILLGIGLLELAMAIRY